MRARRAKEGIDDPRPPLARCQERDVAVQTIKAVTRRPCGNQRHTTATWCEPLHDEADIDLAVYWVLGQPGVFLNSVGDITVLPKILDAASRFKEPPSEMRRTHTDY